MTKKFILSIISILFFLSIGSYSFAMDNVTNDIRNFVGGTENVVENMVNDAASGIQNGLNTVENGTENIMNDVSQDSQNTENTLAGVVTNTSGYSASMTSSNQDSTLSNNMWTWMIVGVVALGIGLIIWNYARSINYTNSFYDSDDE